MFAHNVLQTAIFCEGDLTNIRGVDIVLAADETNALITLVDEEIALNDAITELSKPKEEGLKQNASFQLIEEEKKESPVLPQEDNLSVTTELDLNYFFQKVAKQSKAGGVKSSQKVQVSRGGSTTEREFK